MKKCKRDRPGYTPLSAKSSNKTSDALAKRLYNEFEIRICATGLRKLRLRDFIRLDGPDTADPVEIAAEAFLYVALDRNDEYVSDPRILESCLAFLDAEVDKEPTLDALRHFKSLLDKRPANHNAIRQWFADTYR